MRSFSVFAVAMLFAATGSIGSSSAQSIAPQAAQWSVAPSFGKGANARENISGAACTATEPAFRSCLAINDQEKYAQLFSITGKTIVPGAVVRLLDNSADGDPDAEGAAYDQGFFYAVGSHGLSRKKAKLTVASFLVFRFPALSQTGKAGEIAAAVQTSSKLREAIRAAEFVGPFAEKPLNANGANIEGIAVDAGRLYVGFRAPSLEGRAFVLSAAVDGVFGSGNLAAKVYPLALGPGRGIRDLARVDGGILVLAGPAAEEQVPASVFLWTPSSGTLKKLADLSGIPAGAKAETLLLLGQTPQHYDALVMFDGISNGGPVEYLIPR